MTDEEELAIHKPTVRVLVVDDEDAIGKVLRSGLATAGFVVEWEGQPQRGIERIATWHPDVIILDYEMPGINGLEFCRQVREWSMVPIIALSVRESDTDKISMLEAGADDYLTKPFSINELIARIRVALRHVAHTAGGQGNDARFTFGPIVLDFNSRQVLRDGQEVHVTPTEYEVLKYLAMHAGRVVTHQNLLRAVWGPQYEDEVQYLRVCMAQLRAKLEPTPSRPRFLVTEPGVGYRLKMAQI
jgi:two-component system, OmpR family, KDP operon response regulator KdpE